MAGPYTSLQDSLYNGVKAIFPNNEVIFSHPNGTEPTGSYVVIYILSMDQIARQYQSTLASSSGQAFPNDYQIAITTPYEALVQFTFVGDESGDMAQEFSQALSNVRYWEEFQRNNLSVMRKSLIRNSPQRRESVWVMDFNQDVTFAYSLRTIQTIDVVEKVEIENSLTGKTFTIPQ